MAMLAILLILPIVCSSKVNITNFNPTAGIRYENIGTVNIITSEWKLLVYYDLHPLLTEATALSTGINVMQHLCEQMQQKTICNDLVMQFKHAEAELSLDNSLLSAHRQKRGALNIIGNVANSLFGVLDSEYANQMSETITAIQNNEQLLLASFKNQTSVIDSTINIVKRDQMTAAKIFSNFVNKLTEITNRIRSDEREKHNDNLFQKFISLALQITITSSNVQRIQAANQMY